MEHDSLQCFSPSTGRQDSAHCAPCFMVLPAFVPPKITSDNYFLTSLPCKNGSIFSQREKKIVGSIPFVCRHRERPMASKLVKIWQVAMSSRTRFHGAGVTNGKRASDLGIPKRHTCELRKTPWIRRWRMNTERSHGWRAFLFREEDKNGYRWRFLGQNRLVS